VARNGHVGQKEFLVCDATVSDGMTARLCSKMRIITARETEVRTWANYLAAKKEKSLTRHCGNDNKSYGKARTRQGDEHKSYGEARTIKAGKPAGWIKNIVTANPVT
jgi:hypothetical protein